jgi:hypothetical protein
VSPVKYELGFSILEDGILHSHRRENLKSYIISHLSRIPFNKQRLMSELSLARVEMAFLGSRKYISKYNRGKIIS